MIPVPSLATLTVGPFLLLGLAIPVLLFGEWLTRKVGWLRHSNIPAPIIGGLLVAVGILICNEARPGWLLLNGSTSSAGWLWPVLPQWNFTAVKPADVERPLLILFFTCIGLNASWRVAKQGGSQLAVYLALAAGLAVLQAGTGIATALALGESALLGLMTSTVALMGGFGTAAGFAPEFEKAGLVGAPAIGVAAAAFGVIAGGLLAGWVGGRLVKKSGLGPAKKESGLPAGTVIGEAARGFLGEVRELSKSAGATLAHLFVLLACMKLGAFLSVMIQNAGLTFPVYMGSLVVAGVVRNVHDLLGGNFLKTECVDGIGSVALSWLLAVVMIDLQLAQLAHAAVPMLVILTVQVILLGAVTYWIVFRAMGRDYEAAVMSSGMIGFGLGATSNALATMRVLVQRFGPAPRAFLIVPVVGAFLIDFVNALLTTVALNFLK
ncbi:sodium/glutamate symporter [Oleiharenicola lentus]|uniref:sodium/glutamate symporter n=1 Tax=Oleiharenicola lentus TaxID=2508720 RepID=UPI003F663646